MGTIESIKKPSKEKLKMTAIQRFIWWKKVFFLTYGILITLLIIPIYMYRKGNIITGIRYSIIFYFILLLIYTLANKVTKKKDDEFLITQGYTPSKVLSWWIFPLKTFFLALRIYVIYLMIVTWGMTYG